MSNNPVLATTLEVLADAPKLMASTLSITWDVTKSQDGYVGRGPSWQGYNAPAHAQFSGTSRLQLMELSAQLSQEFQIALQRRFEIAMGMGPRDTTPPPPPKPSGSMPLSFDTGFSLTDDGEVDRKVRLGKLISLIEGVCQEELEVLVGQLIECLRFFKSVSNPFAADNFAAAMLAALEKAVPDTVRRHMFLEVMAPCFTTALQSALRVYSKSMARHIQAAIAQSKAENNNPAASAQGRDGMGDEFLPTMPMDI